MDPGATIQRPVDGDSTVTPRSARAAMVISMWGRLGRRSPEWVRSSPFSKRLAESSRALTNWLDAEESSVTELAEAGPATVNGSLPASAVTSAPRELSASSRGAIGRA